MPFVLTRGALHPANATRPAPPPITSESSPAASTCCPAVAPRCRLPASAQRSDDDHAGVQRAVDVSGRDRQARSTKTIPGMEIEIVIVESNSTDGTRDEVRKFEGHPRVTIDTRSAARQGPRRARGLGACDRRLTS